MSTTAELADAPPRRSLWQRVLLGRRQVRQRTNGSAEPAHDPGRGAMDRRAAGGRRLRARSRADRRLTSYFDQSLETVLRAQILSAEIGPDGEVMFNRTAADQRFLEPYSGLYWQVSGAGHDDFPSRSLWDRQLDFGDAARHTQPFAFDSDHFRPRSCASSRRI